MTVPPDVLAAHAASCPVCKAECTRPGAPLCREFWDLKTSLLRGDQP